MEDALTSQQQHDNDAVAAAAAAAAAAQLGLGDLQSATHQQHHFHHNLQQPDFSHTKDDGTPHQEVDVHTLDIPVEGHDDVGLSGQDTDLDLSLSMAATPHDSSRNTTYGRPPSIRKGEY